MVAAVVVVVLTIIVVVMIIVLIVVTKKNNNGCSSSLSTASSETLPLRPRRLPLQPLLLSRLSIAVAEVIYFASPAEVLFDGAGRLKASPDGLVSAAWRHWQLWWIALCSVAVMTVSACFAKISET